MMRDRIPQVYNIHQMTAHLKVCCFSHFLATVVHSQAPGPKTSRQWRERQRDVGEDNKPVRGFL